MTDAPESPREDAPHGASGLTFEEAAPGEGVGELVTLPGSSNGSNGSNGSDGAEETGSDRVTANGAPAI